MASNHLAKAAMLMVVIILAAVTSWELYLRNKGLEVTYDDGGPLFADKRAMVYEPQDKATVFIGSSRIKYDLDIPTWEAMTGDHAIQLACVGSSPLPVLKDLAADENFKGKLVVDVTEGLFFGLFPGVNEDPEKYLKYSKEETPAQKAGFYINHFLESKLVFLDKASLSLTGKLDALYLKSRPGVFMMPIFPLDFEGVQFDRQCLMTKKFVADTALQRQVTDIWSFFASMSKDDKPVSGPVLDSMLNDIKLNTDKIKARGGKVLFVRTPSSGPYGQAEQMGYPREKYWQRVLDTTGCPGMHFKDYPATAGLICPEWSHLTPTDAVIFTKEFIRVLQEEKGWSFTKTAAK
ncbi:MAG: hypothetical protein QM791_20765 [Ferruginibacter sp.]